MRDFLQMLLPAVAIYLGALSVVRYDVSKIEKKIDHLELEIIDLKKVIKDRK